MPAKQHHDEDAHAAPHELRNRREMLGRSGEWRGAERETMCRAIVCAVSEPADTRRTVSERVGIFQRFAKELKKCGMTITAQETDRWARRMKAVAQGGKTQEVEQEPRKLTNLVPVRAAVRRRAARWRPAPLHRRGGLGRAVGARVSDPAAAAAPATAPPLVTARLRPSPRCCGRDNFGPGSSMSNG